MFKTSNRPISPHITIYLPQWSSLFSIWHRISGLLLTSSLFFSLFLLKSNYWWLSFKLYYMNTSSLCCLFSIYLITFLYHFFNGLRHILWDFNLLLTTKLAFLSSLLVIIFVTLFQAVFIKIFLY
uniref:Succinate:cytochrome c oxidoreductase subunit 3 n=1 Tax=Paralemanea sp. TaxID=2048601 RepID=A0A343UXZ8_9FLOR|nr:succinate:cytochrome c oxidoreductase subunit 3 [Paralemanea sp.]